MHTQELEVIEDAIDSALIRRASAKTNGEFASIDEVLAERDLTQADFNG